ncbi:MAG: hypothetical protein ACLFNQ_11560 [Spirochaetaceae bacterium]
MALLVTVLLGASGYRISAKERVFIAPPDRAIHTPEVYAALAPLLSRAAHEASELFPDRFAVTSGTSSSGTFDSSDSPTARQTAGGDYRLTVLAQTDGANSSLVLTLIRASDGASSPVFPLLGAWDENLPRMIAHAIRYLHQSFTGFDLAEQASPAVFLDEFTADMVSMLDVGQTARMFPYSVDVGPDGNILLGALLVAVELDRVYREVDKPGREIYTRDSINYGMDVRVSPAGTIYSRTMGDDLFIIRPGFPRYQRVRLGITSAVASAALSDGSYVATSGNNSRRVYEGQVESLDLALHPNAYMNVLAAGPEATIWTWDMVAGALLVFTASGERTDTIVPLMSEQDRRAVRALRVLDDGSFIVLTMNALYRLDRTGVPVWTMDNFPQPLRGDFAMIMSMAVDEERGYIYLLNPTGQRMVRLFDPDLAQSPEQFDIDVAELRQRDGADALEQLADLYEEAGAYGLALEARRALLSRDPFDVGISDAFDRSEGRFLAGHARTGVRNALEVLRTIGPETARPLYVGTVQQYEQALARLRNSPEDRAEVASELAEFQRRFSEFESPRIRPPRLDIAGLTDLFPALIQTYQTTAAGSAIVTNTLDEDLTDVSVRTSFRFTDFPDESETVSNLAPGETAELPLFLTLSPDVLSIQEDIPVLLELTLRYTRAGTAETFTRTQTVRVRRNTALLWDDSGKLASFVTPNDVLVQDFALAALQGAPVQSSGIIPRTVLNAATIANSLGVFGIRYIEDPESPFTEVFGVDGVLDTVRFPRTTLRLRTGDCDDTSALLSSLYEATGIATAIMTSPGHVFIAFDTGEPAANRWIFEGDGTTVIPHNGTLWIPVETTILDEGFVASWREASRLMRAHEGEIEFLPLADQRSSYPPIPLGPPAFQIVAPPAASIQVTAEDTLLDLNGLLYAARVEELTRQASSDTRGGTAWAGLQNRIGSLHARAGDLVSARNAFAQIERVSPDNVPALINLANLLLLEGDFSGALERAERVLAMRPRSVAAMNLALQAALAGGRTPYARSMLTDLHAVDPTLAGRIAAAHPGILGEVLPEPREALGERASSGVATLPELLWVFDDEY